MLYRLVLFCCLLPAVLRAETFPAGLLTSIHHEYSANHHEWELLEWKNGSATTLFKTNIPMDIGESPIAIQGPAGWSLLGLQDPGIPVLVDQTGWSIVPGAPGMGNLRSVHTYDATTALITTAAGDVGFMGATGRFTYGPKPLPGLKQSTLRAAQPSTAPGVLAFLTAGELSLASATGNTPPHWMMSFDRKVFHHQGQPATILQEAVVGSQVAWVQGVVHAATAGPFTQVLFNLVLGNTPASIELPDTIRHPRLLQVNALNDSVWFQSEGDIWEASRTGSLRRVHAGLLDRATLANGSTAAKVTIRALVTEYSAKPSLVTKPALPQLNFLQPLAPLPQGFIHDFIDTGPINIHGGKAQAAPPAAPPDTLDPKTERDFLALIEKEWANAGRGALPVNASTAVFCAVANQGGALKYHIRDMPADKHNAFGWKMHFDDLVALDPNDAKRTFRPQLLATALAQSCAARLAAAPPAPKP